MAVPGRLPRIVPNGDPFVVEGKVVPPGVSLVSLVRDVYYTVNNADKFFPAKYRQLLVFQHTPCTILRMRGDPMPASSTRIVGSGPIQRARNSGCAHFPRAQECAWGRSKSKIPGKVAYLDFVSH